MSMTPAIKDILARLLTYEDSTQRNVLHYAVVQCNETLVKKILVALALVQPPGGIERTIRQGVVLQVAWSEFRVCSD
eukprot:m.1004981 g.1004981  ORF g.1004981 m.1004981 type:complete len:77 (+) comp24048_c0_seq68:766-996(+)